MQRPTAKGLREAFTNLAVALLYLSFAYAHWLQFARHHRASVVLVVAFEALFALFFLARGPADEASSSAWSWITTLGGTFTPLLLRPSDAAQDVPVGQVLQVLGVCLGICGVVSLNRSIGLLPAHRGIKSTGLYRWVRHPLYSTYTLANVGYLASNLSARNAALVALALAFQVLRIFTEEELLSRYPVYAEYKARTRWRLVPFVF